MMSRASGPLIAMVAHCSVIDVKRTLRSVHSVWI